MSSLITHLSLLACFTCLTHADEVFLTQGDSLHGDILGIDENGVLRLDYAYSLAPLELKASSVESCLFDQVPEDSASSEHGRSRVTLLNGDSFTGELTELTEDALTFTTPYSGELTIPRDTLDSAAFNLVKRRSLYSGPNLDEGWSDNDIWTFSHGYYKSDADGIISKNLSLPEIFILKLRYEWENSPSLTIHLCEEPGSEPRKDRYSLSITRQGMKLRREITGNGRQFNDLATILKKPSHFPDRFIDLEFRIDRKNNSIHIFVNGEEEVNCQDLTKGNRARGTFISFQSTGGVSSTNIVSDIQLFEWDASRAGRQNEERSEDTMDLVIDSFGNHYTGTAKGVVDLSGKPTLLFENPHARDVMKIPLAHTSTLFFQKNDDSHSTAGPASPLIISLGGNGHLNVNSMALSGDKATVEHPVLGTLEIDRRALQKVIGKSGLAQFQKEETK